MAKKCRACPSENPEIVKFCGECSKLWKRGVKMRVRKSIPIFAIIAIFVISEGASAQWARICRPPGGTIYAIVAGEKSLVASTARGEVFVSTDDAKTWKEASAGLPADCFVQCLAFSGPVLFAGTERHLHDIKTIGLPRLGRGIYVSADKGASWREASVGLPSECAIRCLSASAETLFAGTAHDGIYVSQDGGRSWVAANTGFPEGSPVASFATLGPNVLAGTWEKGVFLSADSGASWKEANSGLPFGTSIRCFAVKGQNVYAGTRLEGIFVSEDYGTNWTSSSSGIPERLTIDSLAVSGRTLYAGTYKGVFISEDDGHSWKPAGSRGPMFSDTLCLAVSQSFLFAGTRDEGVLVSSDNGASWVPSNTGLTSANVFDLTVIGSRLYAHTLSDIFVSDDSGDSWMAVASKMPRGTRVRGIRKIGKNLFADATPGGLFLSKDNGKSWKSANSGLPHDITLDHAVESGSKIFISSWDHGIFISEDNGSSWKPASTGLPKNMPVRRLVLSGKNLFSVMGIDAGPLFLSTDDGSSWEAVSWSLEQANWIDDLDEVSGCLIAFKFQEIYRSMDHGVSWKRLDSKKQYGGFILWVVEKKPYTYLVPWESTKIFRSRDNGETWEPCGMGLPENDGIRSLLNKGSDLIAGTQDHGIFLSTDGNSAWKPINEVGLENVKIGRLTINDKYLFVVTYDDDVLRLPLARIIGFSR